MALTCVFPFAFAQAAGELKGRALLAKVDTEAHPQLAQRFAIRSIPTLVRLDGGRESQRRSGALPAAQIVAKIDANARGGSIVLMHLGGWNTLDALPGILAALENRGLIPVTLDEMFGT